MENKVCLDSNFLIDLLRNKKTAVEWLENNKEKQFCTTSINVFELFYGAYKSNKGTEIDSCESLFEGLPILNLTERSAKKAGKIAATLDKNGKHKDFRDILIASVAITKNIGLKTENKKDFENIEGLRLVV
ncbi:MAG: type II toxin-antitoxin system VapC family toxin [Nanoarchaeota archaeon]